MAELPSISVIIPVKPGGNVTALKALRRIDYPSDRLEVLVAEGRQPSRQRNRAAEAATGGILCFLDDDSRVSADYLLRVAGHFTDSSVAVAGGPSLTPATDSPLQQAFGIALSSLLGGGGMRNRYRRTGTVRETCDRELILCNLCFRADLFRALGGFDLRLYPNEENELMDRIRQGGGRLLHDPDLAVERSQRPTLGAFCRQLTGYGRGRGEQTLISGKIKPITFVPSLFLLYVATLPLIHKAVYSLPLLCYLILVLAASAAAAVRTGLIRSALMLPLVYLLFHLCYGYGMFRGLLLFRRKRPVEQADVTLNRIKEFGKDWRPWRDQAGTGESGAVG